MSITKIINATGKSRRQICAEAGLSSAMLSLIESGERKIGVGKLAALADALNVSPALLRPDLHALFAGQDSLACDRNNSTDAGLIEVPPVNNRGES